MNDRVYVLLKVVEGNSAQVVRSLQGKQGVIMADVLESSGDVMMVAEASERQRLAELTVQAIISVENLTGEVKLLPVKIESPESLSEPSAQTYIDELDMFKGKSNEEVICYGQNPEAQSGEVLCV